MDTKQPAWLGAFYSGETLQERAKCSRIELADALIPRARKLGVLAADDDCEHLAHRFRNGTIGQGAAMLPFQRHRGQAKGPAELSLLIASFTLIWAERDLRQGANEAEVHLKLCGIAIARADGAIDTLEAGNEALSRKGANGRKLIGETSRQRTRIAAAALKGKMSRDAAAFKIADEISQSPATVRRRLSELFPGNQWDEKSDESADGAR